MGASSGFIIVCGSAGIWTVVGSGGFSFSAIVLLCSFIFILIMAGVELVIRLGVFWLGFRVKLGLSN